MDFDPDAHDTVVEDIRELDGVFEVAANKAFREVFAKIDPTISETYTNLPDGTTVTNIHEREDEDEGNYIEAEFDITAAVMEESPTTPSEEKTISEDEHEFFPGEYTDDAMAFLKTQIDLYEPIRLSVFIDYDDEDDQHGLLVSTYKEFDSTHLISEVLNAGYSITAFTIQNGDIKSFVLEFDYTSEFNRSQVDWFRSHKIRSWKKRNFKSSEPIELDCGHELEPHLFAIQKFDENQVESFPEVNYNGKALHKVQFKDVDAFAKTIAEWPDGESPIDTGDESIRMGFLFGYHCEDCSTGYFAEPDDELLDSTYEPLPTKQEQVKVGEDEYFFIVFDKPYLP